MVLFAAKVYASVTSGSLAIVASTLDSLLDLLSGFILWFTAFSMQTPNPYQYPIGKKRMQPLVCIILLKDYSYIYILCMWFLDQILSGNPSICISDGHTWIANHLGISSDNVIQCKPWPCLKTFGSNNSHNCFTCFISAQGVQLNKRARELGGWDHALRYIGQTASRSLLQILH